MTSMITQIQGLKQKKEFLKIKYLPNVSLICHLTMQLLYSLPFAKSLL